MSMLSTSMRVMMQVKTNGSVHYARISRSLLEMINSPECDPKLRQEVIDAATATEPSYSSAPSNKLISATPLESLSRSSENVDTSEAATSYSTEQSKEEELLPEQLFHLWTPSEEEALISVRGEFEEEFNKNLRHDVLWKEVTKKNISFGINVTNVQVKNKWYKLKKDYRKAVDENNNTGNNPAKFKYFDDFNRIYGNRASTKPLVVFDSGNKRPLTTDTESDPPASNIPKKGKKESAQKTARNFEKSPNLKIMEKLEQQNKDIVTEIRKQHDEKLERFDRFLDLFEKSVTNKNSDQ